MKSFSCILAKYIIIIYHFSIVCPAKLLTYINAVAKQEKKIVSFLLFSKDSPKKWLLQKLVVSNVYLETTKTDHNRLQLNLGLCKIGLLKKNCVDLKGTVRHEIK